MVCYYEPGGGRGGGGGGASLHQSSVRVLRVKTPAEVMVMVVDAKHRDGISRYIINGSLSLGRAGGHHDRVIPESESPYTSPECQVPVITARQMCGKSTPVIKTSEVQSQKSFQRNVETM